MHLNHKFLLVLSIDSRIVPDDPVMNLPKSFLQTRLEQLLRFVFSVDARITQKLLLPRQKFIGPLVNNQIIAL